MDRVRLLPEHANHVWSYDFVSAKTHDGGTARMLNLIDEHSRECLPTRDIAYKQAPPRIPVQSAYPMRKVSRIVDPGEEKGT